MESNLSPKAEAYLASVVADGLFPSKQAALEAAVDVLRATVEHLPMVPAEHMEAVEQGIASARAGRLRQLTDVDWENLRQFAEEVAARKHVDTP